MNNRFENGALIRPHQEQMEPAVHKTFPKHIGIVLSWRVDLQDRIAQEFRP